MAASFANFSRTDMREGTGAMTARLSDKRPLNERLALEAIHLRQKAELMPAGAERDALLKKARRLDVASQLNNWLTSSELKPPT
jgi:hypothetical protein